MLCMKHFYMVPNFKGDLDQILVENKKVNKEESRPSSRSELVGVASSWRVVGACLSNDNLDSDGDLQTLTWK